MKKKWKDENIDVHDIYLGKGNYIQLNLVYM